jgi:hypothetical protein
MATGADICNQALKKAGILGLGNAAQGGMISDALTDLNDMIAEWRRQRWLVFHLTDLSKVATGAASYTVGPGGDFNIAFRPPRLEGGFWRQIVSAGLDVDFPMSIIPAREDYNNVALKGLTSFPRMAFYDSAYPLGVLRPYPVPNASIYEIHLSVLDVITAPLTLAGTVSLPEEYFSALKFNLARRLRQAYGKGKQPDVELNALAKNALDVIRNANVQVPQMQMPAAVLHGGSGYNIYSDS